MKNRRGLETLFLVLIAGDPQLGRAIHEVQDESIRPLTLRVRESLCKRKYKRDRLRIVLGVFDMMVAGRGISDIAKLLGFSRQYISQVYKYLLKLPEFKELKRSLKRSLQSE